MIDCPKCGKNFKTKYTLKTHLEKRKIKCDEESSKVEDENIVEEQKSEVQEEMDFDSIPGMDAKTYADIMEKVKEKKEMKKKKKAAMNMKNMNGMMKNPPQINDIVKTTTKEITNNNTYNVNMNISNDYEETFPGETRMRLTIKLMELMQVLNNPQYDENFKMLFPEGFDVTEVSSETITN